MKTASFKLHPKFTVFKKFQDIHWWEEFVTGGIVLYMTLTGFNILLIMCSVYPALIFHKGFINIGSGLDFFATTTDDDTTADGNPVGATYGFKLFKFKIKRSSNVVRLTLAGLSIIGVILIYFFHWSLAL